MGESLRPAETDRSSRIGTPSAIPQGPTASGTLQGRTVTLATITAQLQKIHEAAKSPLETSQESQSLTATVTDLTQSLKSLDLKSLSSAEKELLSKLLQQTRVCLDKIGIPTDGLIQTIASCELSGSAAVTELATAAQALERKGKLEIAPGSTLRETRRRPLAWLSQKLGRVGTSDQSLSAARSLIFKLNRACKDGDSLTDAECLSCLESLRTIDNNRWFQACLKHLSPFDRGRLTEARKYFEARTQASIDQAQKQLSATFQEKIRTQQLLADQHKKALLVGVDSVRSEIDKLKNADAKKELTELLNTLAASQSRTDMERNIEDFLKKLTNLALKEMKTISSKERLAILTPFNKNVSKWFNEYKSSLTTINELQAQQKSMSSHLQAHGRELMEEARSSPLGSATASKSEAIIPYTLRCFINPESGTCSFELHLDIFASGGEANIKNVINLTTGETFARRKLTTKPDVESAQKQREELSLLARLSGIPGILQQTATRYAGKGGKEKEEVLSKKYAGGSLEAYAPSSMAGKEVEQKNKAIADQLVTTISQMLDKGVVHRDLKPQNILLDKDGSIAVIDFGLAAMSGSQVRIQGSPGYMPPELLTCSDAVPSSPAHDLWSLGMVLLNTMSKGTPRQQELQGHFETINKLQSQMRTLAETPDAPNREQALKTLQQQHETELVTLREKLVAADNPAIAAPYGSIIAALLDPNPSTRMTTKALREQWPTERA